MYHLLCDGVVVGEYEWAQGLDGQQVFLYKKKEYCLVSLELGSLFQEFEFLDTVDFRVILVSSDSNTQLYHWNLDGSVILMSDVHGSGIQFLVPELHFDSIASDVLGVFDRWSRCWPQDTGEWVHERYDVKRAWLNACSLLARISGCDQPPGRTYKLEGNHITDYASFFLAIGEAIVGPTGYLGKNLTALDDCLIGNFGVRTPFRLEWSNYSTSQRALTHTAWNRELLYCMESGERLDEFILRFGQAESLWESIMETLQARGVEVVLC